MASTVPFYKLICLVLWASLACLSVSAKPLELLALSQRRYMSDLPQVVDVTEALCDKDIDSVGVGVGDYPPATLLMEMPTCIDDGRCSSGCMITDAAANKPTHICTPPLYCSLYGEGTGATFSCHTQSQGTGTAKLDALFPISTDQNVAPFKPNLHQDFATPPAYTAQPEAISEFDTNNLPPSPTSASSMTDQYTITVQVANGQDGGPDGPTMAPSTINTPSSVPGQETVYLTITSDRSSPTATAAGAKVEPDYTNDPEPNKTVIILGSIFGTMMVIGVLIVYLDRLRRRRRQKRQELQELQERHASASSAEDVSELLRQQQQTYGYYGTQRIASGCVVPQEAKVFPSTSEPAELANPEDEIMETERRDGH